MSWLCRRGVIGPIAAQYSVLSTQYSVLGNQSPATHSSPPRPLSPSPPLSLLVSFIALSLISTAHCQEKSSTEPVLRPPSGPAEVFERFDIGPSQLESFFSGQPLSPSEEDVLVKILYHFPRLGLENLARWRQRDVTWDQLAAAPTDRRAQVFHLKGRVKRVEKQSLLPEQSELYEFNHYYRVKLALENSPYEALIAARRVPTAWPLDAPLDERAETDAIFLKVGDSTAQQPQLVFAAGAISWFPDRPDPQHHIGPSQLALARLGMDISLWDDIRDSKDPGLTAADREAFYQLLTAVGRLDTTHSPLTPPAPADHSLDLVPLLENPTEHFGDVLPVEGVARRVMKVPVSDADIRSRFGIDHYYEIDLFLPLGDAALRFGKDPSGEKNPIYRNTFPATLIVRQLPRGLKEGENVHELVRADGVFFKIWAYRSSYTARFGQLQPAPLFIASKPQLVRIEPTANRLTGALVLAALLLSLGVAAVIVWWYGYSDRKARRKMAAARRETLDFRF